MSKQITDLIVYWGDNVMANLYVWDVEVVKAWGPIWVGLTTAIATLFIQSRQNKRQNELTLEALRTTRQAQEREEIIRQLTKFYGPLRELRVQSLILYDKFALNIRQEYKKNKIQYRTLTYLVTKGTGSLTETDKDLLKQIVAIGKLSLKLIECQAGVVDKPALRKLLGQWGAHIRLLEMAANNELSGKPEIYDDIVFPRAIDGALESAILRLEARLVELSGRGTPHFIKGPTLHAKASEKSLTYYDRHANAYREKTAHVNLEHLWNEFIGYIPRGGRILDAGCGVGRDTRHFIESGFIVVSIDASWQMVLRCRENPHAYCLWMNFDEMTYHEEFDAIWSCASLVHAPPSEARSFVNKFETAVTPGGIIFLSVRYDSVAKSSDKYGRTFYNYDDNNFRGLFETNKHLTLEALWVSFSERSESTNDKLRWLNIILRKH